MNFISEILPLRNSNLWKGLGLGVALCLLAIAIPTLMRTKMSALKVMETGYTKIQGGGGGAFLTLTVEANGPKIVRTAELNLLVEDCGATLKKVETLAAAENGLVEASTVEENSATITLRVPSSRLDDVRAKLREFAIRTTQDSVGTSDVTKQYFDNEARLRNLRAQEQQYLQIMKKAHTVPDVLAVTKSLDDVRGEIEQDDADFRRMKNQVELAKIDIHLLSQSAPSVRWSAGSSTRAAWDDFLQSLAGFVDFLIWLVVNLPVIILWLVIAFLLVAAGWFVLRTAIRALRAIFWKKAAEPAKV
ncbi:MAG TPA: DUF4349 domain-containing protein [Terriglobales bacterium]|nr:DUF4349 domain-containing protein [Terriglobales bacterium]